MTNIVNDNLSLAQFITNGRSEEQAVTYLLALEALSIDSWRVAKRELDIEDTTNHRTKEGFIKQIVSYMKNEDTTGINYCLKDLTLCPGFSKEAIELAFYSSATIHCVQTVASNIARAHTHAAQAAGAERTHQDFSRMTNQNVQGQVHTQSPFSPASNTQPQQTAASSSTASHSPQVADQSTANETDFPPLNNTANTNSAGTDNESLAPPAGKRRWEDKGKRNSKYKSGNEDKPTQKKWIYGSSASSNSHINQQLRPVCLGVRSGAEETVQSLTEVLNKWNCVKDLKIEAVRKSHHSTTFRVAYNIAVSLVDKWKDPSAWPTRCWAAVWRGNPRAPLTPLTEQVHKIRLYVGNLSPATTKEKITSNMKAIYKEEIDKGVIQKVETILNETGLDMARKRHSVDPTQAITMSACVILSSPPGKELTDVGLKLGHYPQEIRRTIRRWNGSLPNSKEPLTTLDW